MSSGTLSSIQSYIQQSAGLAQSLEQPVQEVLEIDNESVKDEVNFVIFRSIFFFHIPISYPT